MVVLRRWVFSPLSEMILGHLSEMILGHLSFTVRHPESALPSVAVALELKLTALPDPSVCLFWFPDLSVK
jgi:hypothetical protein